MCLKIVGWISVITMNNLFVPSFLSGQLTDVVSTEITRADMQLEAQQIINQIYKDLLNEFYSVTDEKRCCKRNRAGEERL